MLLVQRDQPTRNSLIAMSNLDEYLQIIYVDGLQILAVRYEDRWKTDIHDIFVINELSYEIVIADLIG